MRIRSLMLMSIIMCAAIWLQRVDAVWWCPIAPAVSFMSAGSNAPANVRFRGKWGINPETFRWGQYALLYDGSLGARVGPPDVKSASVVAAGKAAAAVGSVAAARVARSCGDGAAAGSGAAAAPGSGAPKAARNGAAAAVGIEQRLPVAAMERSPLL